MAIYQNNNGIVVEDKYIYENNLGVLTQIDSRYKNINNISTIVYKDKYYLFPYSSTKSVDLYSNGTATSNRSAVIYIGNTPKYQEFLNNNKYNYIHVEGDAYIISSSTIGHHIWSGFNSSTEWGSSNVNNTGYSYHINIDVALTTAGNQNLYYQAWGGGYYGPWDWELRNCNVYFYNK